MHILSDKEYHELLRKADAGEVAMLYVKAMLDNAPYDTASDDMKSFLRRLQTHSDWYYDYIPFAFYSSYLVKEVVTMFENNRAKNTGINYSRYIASWRSIGGYIYRPMRGNWEEGSFQDWLHSEGLTDDEIYECTELATCGKSELNDSAKRFMRSHGYINI